MEYDDFDARRRALLRLARPQDLLDADGEVIDLDAAAYWLWRHAQLMQGFRALAIPHAAVDDAALDELRQLVELALQVIRGLQRRQARMPVPPLEP